MGWVEMFSFIKREDWCEREGTNRIRIGIWTHLWNKSVLESLCVTWYMYPSLKVMPLGALLAILALLVFCLLDSMNQGHFMPSICQLKFSSSGLCCYVSLGESRSALWFLNYAPQVLWEAQDILRGLWGQTILIIIQKHCLFHCVYICTDNTEEVVPKSDAPLITNQGSITSLY